MRRGRSSRGAAGQEAFRPVFCGGPVFCGMELADEFGGIKSREIDILIIGFICSICGFCADYIDRTWI